MRATYSPEDNKLRLYAETRLDAETYARVKAAGFKWAPKQDLFVSPMWTPSREDLLLDLCGEITDEDTSLIERQEGRAERFGEYCENRKEDAQTARAAVSAIADNIPLGQPILVGHHSERHARKDAERIESGMRRAVKAWECAEYWQRRARAAIAHAKYKERPDVRARRIKGIEADKRKQERNKAEAEHVLRFWSGRFTVTNKATGEKRPFEITEENRSRIYEVIDKDNALAYSGRYTGIDGTCSYSAWDCLRPAEERYENCPEKTVAELAANAIAQSERLISHYQRWIAHYENRLAYERAMLEADGGRVTDRKGPEKGGACRCWASHRGAWSWIVKVNKVSVTVLDNWGNEGQMDGKHNFTRNIPFDKLSAVMTAAEVQAARDCGTLIELSDKTGFVLRSSEPTKPAPTKAESTPEKAQFDALKQTLAAGVQVVSADQLFPTPTPLAERVVDLADLVAGDKVLEPSAGTGQLLKAAIRRGIFRDDLTAIEINRKLADLCVPHAGKVLAYDFLTCNGDLGTFDKILMNPPFSNGQDIKHIQHALTMLNPGGRLVAICANGPRQRESLQPLATDWIDLEPGAFKESGTNVNAAIVVINKGQ